MMTLSWTSCNAACRVSSLDVGALCHFDTLMVAVSLLSETFSVHVHHVITADPQILTI
jgi:hypothetical protein